MVESIAYLNRINEEKPMVIPIADLPIPLPMMYPTTIDQKMPLYMNLSDNNPLYSVISISYR